MSTPRIEAAERLEEASTRALKPRSSDIRWQCLGFLVTAAFVGWQVGRGPGIPEWLTLPAIVALPIITGWLSRRSRVEPRGALAISIISMVAAFTVGMVGIFGRSTEAREVGSLA